MRDVRRLPPFLRVVSAIGLLFPIAAFMLLLLLNPYWSPFHVSQANFGRTVVIAMNLCILGVACSFTVAVVNTRLRQPGRRWRIPLDAWQGQSRAVALAVLVPLGGLIMNLATAPSFEATRAFLVVMVVVSCWPVIVIGLLALG